jgi:hypothetical protein
MPPVNHLTRSQIPGPLTLASNEGICQLDMRNGPRAAESSLITPNDSYSSVPGNGSVFFSVPDSEGYDDLYWVDLRGRSPSEPRQVNGEGSVFAYTVEPYRDDTFAE